MSHLTPHVVMLLLGLAALTYGLTQMGIASGWEFWTAIGTARFVLWNARRLPLRLARFLDWSVAAGFLRTSGVAYQFRHREFQERLARNPLPVPQP